MTSIKSISETVSKMHRQINKYILAARITLGLCFVSFIVTVLYPLSSFGIALGIIILIVLYTLSIYCDGKAIDIQTDINKLIRTTLNL